MLNPDFYGVFMHCVFADAIGYRSLHAVGVKHVIQQMRMLGGIAAGRGQITAISPGDKAAVKQALRRCYQRGLSRFVDLDAFQAGRRFKKH